MPRLRSKSTEARIYWRTRGGVRRAYLDVRDYRDVADKAQRALILPGESRATSDPVLAAQLAADHLAELERRRRDRPTVVPGDLRLGQFIIRHLQRKMRAKKKVGGSWMDQAGRHLKAARSYFKADRMIDTISAPDVANFAVHLQGLRNGRGGALGPGTVNQYLNSLSNMFKSAIFYGHIQVNPVAGMSEDRPAVEEVEDIDDIERKFLEVSEVGKVLAWARDFTPKRTDLATPCLYELLAMYALTGCRRTEVLGLRREEVQLAKGRIKIQHNAWRRLKTKRSKRTLRIPPQLVEILQAYESGPNAPQGDLYFPASTDGGGEEAMIGDFEKLLDRCPMPRRFHRWRTDAELEFAKRQRGKMVDARRRKMEGDAKARGREGLSDKQKATLEKLSTRRIRKISKKPLRPLLLRHTWCAARLQCVREGEPISIYEVATEMGHKDPNMIRDIYGHVQDRPPCRKEFVEYPVPEKPKKAGGNEGGSS